MSLAERLQVMVVDDTSVSRMLVIEALNQIGIRQISFAKDGKSALDSLMVKPVHLVISDMNMPGLDGLELLKGLRSFAPTSKIGFILLTGSADKTLIDRGRAHRMNNYVTKPFTPDRLKSAIEAVVGRLS